MKVLLINPPLKINYRDKYIKDVIGNLFYNSSPLGLCYLAGELEKENIPVKIVDAAVERLNYPDILKRIKDFSADIVGITSVTCNFLSAVELAKEIKKGFPHIITVLGGPHISANPAHAFSFGCFDIGVFQEGEITLLELARAIEDKIDLSQVKGLILRKDGKIFFTPARGYIQNLDLLPFPARHLLPMDLYQPQFNDEYILPKLSMITSRGCPYSCTFCDKSVFQNQYRCFSPEYIVSEIQHLIEKFSVRDIAFVDSLFMVSTERVEAIINKMKEKNVKVNWTCTMRANIATYDILKKMKEAGCWRVRIGIESGCDRILKSIKKNITTQQVRNVTNWAHKLGLQPKGFFMIGHLEDTRDSIEESVRFARSIPLKDITLQMNTPMFNTAQYQVYKDYGRIEAEDFNEFSYWQPVFIPKGLTRAYLLKAFQRFYRLFYLRPVIFWRHISTIRHWYNVARYFRASRLVFHLFFSKIKEIKIKP